MHPIKNREEKEKIPVMKLDNKSRVEGGKIGKKEKK